MPNGKQLYVGMQHINYSSLGLASLNRLAVGPYVSGFIQAALGRRELVAARAFSSAGVCGGHTLESWNPGLAGGVCSISSSFVASTACTSSVHVMHAVARPGALPRFMSLSLTTPRGKRAAMAALRRSERSAIARAEIKKGCGLVKQLSLL